MKANLRILMGALAVSMLTPLGPAQADPLSGLYNTGVDNSYSLLGDGVVDTHYVISPSWSAISNTPPPPPSFSGAWLPNNPTDPSRWIAPASEPTNDVSGAVYILSLTFDLTGFDYTTASFFGRWATDNSGDVTLNGGPSLGSSGGFNGWSSFSAGSGFVAGLNTLQFSVTNAPYGGPTNPTGLRVEFQQSSVNAIPEPEIYATMMAGLGLMGFVAHRRRVKVKLTG